MSRKYAIPDIAETEYLRGKAEERSGVIHPHTPARFNARGNDTWAYRSGRTYFEQSPEATGSGMDYSSPVTGNGRKMGNLSALVGGRTRKMLEDVEDSSSSSEKECSRRHRMAGKGSPDYDTLDLMSAGQARNIGSGAKPKRVNRRSQIVAKVMKEKGLSLPEASKYVKTHNMY